MHIAPTHWAIPAGAIVLIWLAAFCWPMRARQTAYDFMRGMTVLARLVGALILTVLVCLAYACAVLLLR
jgi:hypothetical protein